MTRSLKSMELPLFTYDEVTTQVKAIKADSMSAKSDTLSLKVSRAGEVLSFKKYFRDQKIIGFWVHLYQRSFWIEQKEISRMDLWSLSPKEQNGLFLHWQFRLRHLEELLPVRCLQKSLSGPIGIMQAFGNEWDWSRFWSLTGVLSLVLSVYEFASHPSIGWRTCDVFEL